MRRHFGIWLGGLAIALLPTMSFAQEATAKTDVKAGPVRVEVHADTNKADGPKIQVQVNGQPVPVQVEKKGVRVQAGPVRVETKRGPDGGVRVHAGPVHVRTEWGDDGPPTQPREYWIGLELRIVPDTLRAHLELPEGQGLVIAKVFPESPAADAGLKQHDILLTVGDKPLGELTDLIEVIGQSKGEPIALGVLRGGKPTKIVVTPAKLPEEARSEAADPEEMPRAWREYAEQFLPQRLQGKGPFRFRFFQPGIILPPDAAVKKGLPAGVSVTITKEGDEPAKIIVKRGEETWEVTDETLDELPDDIRPHIVMMRAGIVDTNQFDVLPHMHVPGQLGGQLPKDLEFHEAKPQTRVERRLEEMNRRIEEMRKSIEKLREKRQ